MKQFLLTVFIILGLSGFSQNVSKKYVDGILYFQLKQNAGYKIPSGSEGQTNLKDFAFLGDMISRYQVTEIQRSFYMAKDEKLLRTYKVFFNNHQGADAFVAELEKKGVIEYAERLPAHKLSYVPNDQYYNYTTVYSGYTLNWKWHLDKINASQAWNISTGSSAIRVAVTDNAIFTTHPDLQNKIVAMRDVADLDNDPNPPAAVTGTLAYEWSHGTHVSGLVGAESDNNIGIASLGFNVSLVAVKIGRNSDGALIAGYEGVTWASTTGQADVINMSWGGPTGGTTAQNVINAAYAQGCVLIAAAGNDGNTGNPVFYPAAFTNCIAVGATNSDDTKADFSEYGTWVDVCSPGGNQLIAGTYFTPLVSTTFNNTLGLNTYYGIPNTTFGSGKYDGMQGTSMASPIVAGLAGLILSVNPAMTQTQVRNCIVNTADNINAVNSAYLGQIGSGRINAYAALQCAQATASVAPTVSFIGSPLSICPGSTVSFTNTTVSTGATTYTWTFQGGTPATSTQTNVTVTYNTPGVYSVTLAATNPYGSSSSVQTGYVTVVSGASLPLVEGFQSAVFPPTNWSLTDDGADNKKWALKTTAGQASTQSTFFDNYNDAANAGYRDQLRTVVDLSGYTTAKMTFYRAYAATFASPNFDSLQIGVAATCGSALSSVYLKGGPTFSTAVNTNTNAGFTPTTATQWKKDSIDLTPYVGQSSVTIAFINRGHYGDNLYLDNINITGTTGAAPVAAITASNTGCTGSTITLTDASTGSPTSWSWSMPGGTPASSTSQNTSVTYATAGVKTISLTVANATGTTTATKTITITATPSLSVTPAGAAICSGGTATLTASGATTYTWLPSGSAAANVVSPASTTVYTVTGSNGSCTGTAVTATVTVNTVPVVTVTPTSTTICSGASTTLTASGATTYTWLPSGSGAANTVSPTSTTVYTVTGSNGGCNSSAKTVTVTVNAAPSVTITPGSTVICSGGSTTLTASGATTYTWLPSGSGTANVVSPSSTTVYTLTGSNGGCASQPKTATVTVNTTPVLTVTPTNTTICSGASTTLTASGASTYTWLPSGSGASNAVSPASTTVYTVTGSNGACVGAPKTVTVTTTAAPVLTVTPTNTTICSGASATLTASGATTYTWLPSGSAATNVVSPASTTVYSVSGTTGGCTSAVRTVTINVTTTPTVGVTASSSTICAGQTATLTGSGATTYNWLPGGQTTAAVSVNPSGTTVYTVTGSNGSCSSSRTISVNVNAIPTVTASLTNTTICSGTPVTVNVGGATSYAWSPSGSGSSSVLSPAATTIYSITGSNGSCTSAVRTVTITVTATPTLGISASSSTICSGQSATLTASGATSYSWLPGGQSTAMISVSPSANTTYTVTGSNGSCSSTSTMVTVNVTATPTLATSVTNTTICSGTSVNVSVSGAISYSWAPSGSGSMSVFSPASTTVYTVTGTFGGCTGAPKTFTINVAPGLSLNVTASSATLCAGQTATLTASGASSYSWQPGSQTAPAITVNPSTTTTYTVTGTNGACSSQVSTMIVVTPTPNVTSSITNTTVCSGTPVTVNVTGGTSYAWAPSGSGSSGTFSPLATTVYTVTSPSACGNGSVTFTINVVSAPVLTASAPSTICAGSMTTLSASGAASYTWAPVTGLSSSTGSTVTANPASSLVYTVTGSNGACEAMQTVPVSVILCVGIEDLSANNPLAVYPNPSTGLFRISAPGNGGRLDAEVLNTLGQTVLKESSKDAETLVVDMNACARGVYYLKVQLGSGTRLVKVVLE